MNSPKARYFFSYNLSRQIKSGIIFCLLLPTLIFPSLAFGQFAPPAGQAGSDAVHADSTIIINWANHAMLQRGLQQINDASYGYATYGNETDAIGKADGFVVSLGDGGSAVLQFDFPLFNGTGADFVVFENAFDEQFLELAHVAVSSDGQNFFTFPAHSLTDTTEQVSGFGTLDAQKIHQLAGKYRAPYGVPFDLDSIPVNILLDKNSVTHLKITDVIGILDHEMGSRDIAGRLINDPWPTPFPSSGFDLDAVGVIHDASNLSLKANSAEQFAVWPNPFQNGFSTKSEAVSILRVYNVQGVVMAEQELISGDNYIDATSWNTGLYVMTITVNRQAYFIKAIKQ
jgi:hypothetical protein